MDGARVRCIICKRLTREPVGKKAVLQVVREEMSFDARGEMLAGFHLPLPLLGRIDRDPLWT